MHKKIAPIFVRKEVVPAMVVSASEIKTNPAFSLLRERDGIPEPNIGVGEIL